MQPILTTFSIIGVKLYIITEKNVCEKCENIWWIRKKVRIFADTFRATKGQALTAHSKNTVTNSIKQLHNHRQYHTSPPKQLSPAQTRSPILSPTILTSKPEHTQNHIHTFL